MKRTDILADANCAITQDRAKTYGAAEDNFSAIADAWAWWLGADVTAHDVGMMMMLFKAARIRSNPAHADSYVDLAGYAALAGEIATEGEA